jgi:hypothetical protein
MEFKTIVTIALVVFIAGAVLWLNARKNKKQ